MPKLNELTIVEALDGLKARRFKSIDLVTACLLEIETHDSKLKAFVTVVKDNALLNAAEADHLISTHGAAIFKEKPLLGIPYACKDNFCTKGIETTASSNILKGFIPPYESTVTKRLQDAGAILLGKTNMDAFAHGSSTDTSDFFPTHNPWDLAKVAGGSSGGSAAAVAANFCLFAIGSETAASIRGPAAWCGITGLKPTYGRVSRYGVIAMASSIDSPGPLTKTVLDAAYVLRVIAGLDPNDATSSPTATLDYVSLLGKQNLRGMRIGKPSSYFDIDLEPGVADLVNKTVDEFQELGAEIAEVELISPKYAIAVYTILQRSEVSSNLARFDGIRYGHPRSKFGFEAKKRMMLGAYSLSSGYYDAYYTKAQKVRTLIIDDFKRVFNEVDLIIGPTMPCVALNIGASDKSPMFGELMDVLAEPSSIAGLCGISIPCGMVSKLPVGIQLIGPQFSEDLILSAAHQYQQATGYHKVAPEI